MSELKCNVINCQSNKDDRCCRADIHVGGESATDHEETCCESFRKLPHDVNMSAFNDRRINETMSIGCSAENCIYNKSGNCTADTVQVIGHTAENIRETACETFECRCKGCR